MRNRDMCKAVRCDFTLGAYGHVTARIKRESTSRMEKFIQSVSSDLKDAKRAELLSKRETAPSGAKTKPRSPCGCGIFFWR